MLAAGPGVPRLAGAPPRSLIAVCPLCVCLRPHFLSDPHPVMLDLGPPYSTVTSSQFNQLHMQ